MTIKSYQNFRAFANQKTRYVPDLLVDREGISLGALRLSQKGFRPLAGSPQKRRETPVSRTLPRSIPSIKKFTLL